MTFPLREVLRYKKAKRGWLLALECAHQVTRRRVPVRARCSECEKGTFNGPLFNWRQHRDTVLTWELIGSGLKTTVVQTADGTSVLSSGSA